MALTGKTLVSELETVAINWQAVARAWAAERGLSTESMGWPDAWDKKEAEDAVHSSRIERWRASCNTFLNGRWRHLGLTFVLAAPSDVAAAGPERHGDDTRVAEEGGAREWEGAKENGACEGIGADRFGWSSASGSESEGVEMEEDMWEGEDAMCEMPPRSPVLGAQCCNGTEEPTGSGMMEGPEELFPASAVPPPPSLASSLSPSFLPSVTPFLSCFRSLSLFVWKLATLCFRTPPLSPPDTLSSTSSFL